MSLTLGVFALTAEAKAAEAAASAYYNPGNPHNVYMPTVRQRGSASAAPQPQMLGATGGRLRHVLNLLTRIFPFSLL